MAKKSKSSVDNNGKNNIVKPATGGITGKGFMPGQSGNPGGRPKKKPFTDALLQILSEKPSEAKEVVQGLLNIAKAGDSSAFKALADRAEGKVLQGIRMEGELGLSTPQERKARVVDFLRKAADRIEGSPTDKVQ